MLLKKSFGFAGIGLVIGSLGLLTACAPDSSRLLNASQLQSGMAQTCEDGESTGAEYLGGSVNGIVNGKTLAQESLFSRRVVLIVSVTKDSTQTCTGSLLPNNTVLTAAHCLNEKAVQTVVAFTHSMGCVNANNVKEMARVVNTLRIHPQYKPNSEATKGDINYDIALLKFEGSVPTGYRSSLIDWSENSFETSEKLFMVGYGNTNYQKEDSGVLRVTYQKGESVNQAAQFPNSIVLAQFSQGVCSGDSGGPLFAIRDKDLKIVGVASAVANPENPSQACNGYSIYASPNRHQKFLKKSYRDLTGAELP